MKKNLLVDHMFGATEYVAIHALTQKHNALRQLVLQDEYQKPKPDNLRDTNGSSVSYTRMA
jgi:hypothetical protein